MNKYVKHFFVSNLTSQTEAATKKALPNHKYGNLLSMGFICGKDEKMHHRLTFEAHSSSVIMDEVEKKRLEGMISINVHKEMIGENRSKKPCKSIFALITVKTKDICIQWSFEDGTSETLHL